LSAASHGTDHLIVQRLLAARNLKDAQRALIGSGVFIILQFALFLLVGTSLWLAGADQPGMRGDAIYPTFIVTHLPRHRGTRGWRHSGGRHEQPRVGCELARVRFDA